jgi:hypothetical protein
VASAVAPVIIWSPAVFLSTTVANSTGVPVAESTTLPRIENVVFCAKLKRERKIKQAAGNNDFTTLT